MALKKIVKPARRRSQTTGILNMVLLCATAIVVAVLLNKRGDVQVSETLNKPQIVAEFDTVPVPVPMEYVPTGTKVGAIKFQHVSYPRHQIPMGALLSLDGYMDLTTIAPLPANLPIFPENIGREVSASNPIVESIPPGMRAMTVQVDATSSVEGWAGSGSIVDVLLVQAKKTSVIAEKVKILSAERSVTPVSAESSPSVPSTVTLLVSQEQCLAINTAIPLGRIAFALRGSSDSERWIDTSYSSDEIKGKSRVARRENAGINGYISIKENGVEKKFALSDGKWLPTESAPDGFLLMGGQDEKARLKTP